LEVCRFRYLEKSTRSSWTRSHGPGQGDQIAATGRGGLLRKSNGSWKSTGCLWMGYRYRKPTREIKPLPLAAVVSCGSLPAPTKSTRISWTRSHGPGQGNQTAAGGCGCTRGSLPIWIVNKVSLETFRAREIKLLPLAAVVSCGSLTVPGSQPAAGGWDIDTGNLPGRSNRCRWPRWSPAEVCQPFKSNLVILSTEITGLIP